MKTKQQNLGIFTTLRRPKLQPKVWIRSNELTKYLNVVIWITGCADLSKDLVTLLSRIKRLVKRSGWNFTFLYLKESQRLLIRAMSGSPEPKYQKNGIIVQRDSHGLPSIIPLDLRLLVLNFKDNQKKVRSLLTLLSVYRVFPTKPRPTLDTITDPFNGIAKTLPSLECAVKEIFGKSVLKLTKPILLKMETAGPNAGKTAWSSSLDALAFISHPVEFFHLTRYAINTGGYVFILWILGISLVGLVPYLILRLFKVLPLLKIGKLGVVLDQAGKARIIAICSYWLQIVLKPLHNSLFRVLKNHETDGTFDQHAPLKLLCNRKDDVNKTFHCFDLSAATDRLPIELQRDILNIARPKLGDLWSQILDIPWWYKGVSYRYSVGQPMGAYSSWGMLAVTHHVIVRYCALRCGIRNFNLYAVLGDDIVIMHDDVAREYLAVMKILGVSINLSKSIVSSEFAEFAKVWRGPNIDITPIGPGLILRTVRSEPYKGVLLGEAVKLHLIESLPQLLTLIRDLKEPLLALWSTLGLGGANGENQVDVGTITWGLSSTPDPKLFLYCLGNSLKQNFLNEWRESKLKNEIECEAFYRNWWKTYSSSHWSLRVLESLLKLVGPGFWIYAFSFERMREKFNEPCPIHTYGYDNVIELRKLVEYDPLLSISSIDWREKKKITKYDSKIRFIADEFDRTLSEMQDFSEML